jgi:serine/threonine-protein kinase
LSHPNIVHFFGLSDFDGQLALVMELVHGESLSELISRVRTESRHGPLPALPLAQAWHYFAQLLGALASIHAFGILHRDVKSSNVLVRGDGVIKLTDFGIAQIPAEEARNTGGMAPGTGAYMSPEQVLNQPLDPRADLYSAAIVLYEMLTGVTPFDRPERNELMARALAKDPKQRYGSAVELGEAFRSSLGLPETPGWSSQRELADVAKTMSQLQMPIPEAAELGQQAARVGTDIMAAFRK